MNASAIRQAAVIAHRWTGLALAAFLIVVASTGAILPFQDDLQKLIAPERYLRLQPSLPIDWLGLRDIAERRSGGRVDAMPLAIAGNAAPSYNPTALPGQPALGFDELILDPASGTEIARARSADLRDGRAQILPFLYLVHQNLALGDFGVTLVGLVALAWTVDCFVGLYLTLPTGRRGWWRRFWSSWTVRLPAPSRFRLHFDLHRAGSLWFWAMLLLFAWTGVAFNLPSVYAPVMHVLTGYERFPDAPQVAPRAPLLGWAEGLAASRARATDAARAQGFAIIQERAFRLIRQTGQYSYAIRTDRDHSDDGANSWINIDADDGHLVSVDLPGGTRWGNTIDYWLVMTHLASFGGLALKMLVSATGIGIVVVTVTGVLIWARKRAARARRQPRAARHDLVRMR